MTLSTPELHFREEGRGEPLLILHGLFGNLENWGAQIKTLAEHYRVLAVDLRNHGRSPWADEMDYPSMATDLLHFLDRHQIEQAQVVGHSMGGKAAMQLAMNHPERVRKLCVVDIAPVRYPPGHNEVFAGLGAVRLTHIQSRSEAEQQLAAHVAEVDIRQFLLKNLYRNGDHFAWRMNLKVLQRDYEKIAEAPNGSAYAGPTLFIKGGDSHYLQDNHRDQIARFFPNATARVMEGVGHWPHAEKPQLFSRILMRFLDQA